jgi:hypothetical protein
MINVRRVALALGVTFILGGCGGDIDASAPMPGPYAGQDLWVCKPGAASNRCLELDQTTTHVYSDTSLAVFEHTPAPDPEFDCFYVYPTVDYGAEPGNTSDLSDDSLVLRPLYNQAARFTELCNMYAPLYRQMTIATYGLAGGYRNSEFFDIAYSDVSEAFSQYLLESGNRPFVLIGHSQGSHMLLELLRQRFENNAALRERLISALLIGPVGELKVPAGEISGGSFDNIPLCTRATDTGCIIAYDSIAATDGEREAVDDPLPCVDPTRLGGNPGILENTIWGTANGMPFPETIDTPWAAYPAMHKAKCAADGFLVIDTVAEDRKPPLTPQGVQAILGGSSLHVADVNYALGDLLRVVATQANSLL